MGAPTASPAGMGERVPLMHVPALRRPRPLSSRRPWHRLGRLSALLLAALAVAACGRSEPPTAPPVTIRAATPAATASPVATPPPAASPAPIATPRAAVPPRAPESGRWIDVDVSRYVVRLMDGKQVVREIGPVAVGREIDTGAYESTQTGLFHVYNKIAPLTFDPPYNTYIQWWVGFDPDKANGFHSFLLDRDGKLADGATGRISNGCIRTGEAEVIYQFAEVGMPVFVRA